MIFMLIKLLLPPPLIFHFWGFFLLVNNISVENLDLEFLVIQELLPTKIVRNLSFS